MTVAAARAARQAAYEAWAKVCTTAAGREAHAKLREADKAQADAHRAELAAGREPTRFIF